VLKELLTKKDPPEKPEKQNKEAIIAASDQGDIRNSSRLLLV